MGTGWLVGWFFTILSFEKNGLSFEESKRIRNQPLCFLARLVGNFREGFIPNIPRSKG